MSRYGAERLYELLPAVLRLRDAEVGLPLSDLVAVLAREAEVVEEDVRRLYESWFVETCQEWELPYLGDLLGITPLEPTGGSRRAEIANTIGYRRRKGTAAVLEQLARDVTGWPARAVEFFELVATTQHLRHVRLHRPATAEVRRADRMELVNGPFDTAAHTAEVRRIAPRRGCYNIPNVGLFLWRLTAYELRDVEPRRVGTAPDDFRYTFDPLGRDVPLFNPPRTETEITGLAGEENVPGPLRRRPLYLELEARREAKNEGRTPQERFFTRDSTPFEVSRKVAKKQAEEGGEPPAAPSFEPIPPERISICDLSDLRGGGWKLPPAGFAAVDPERGRLAFASEPGGALLVTFSYGFSGDVGGGPYARAEGFTELSGKRLIKVGQGQTQLPTLAKAIQQWGGRESAVIEIQDSRTYEENLKPKAISTGHRLEIRAADGQRPTLLLTRPMVVRGGSRSAFELNGVLMIGRPLRVQGGLGRLAIRHSTLVPGTTTRLIVSTEGETDVLIERSILGRVRAALTSEWVIRESILDAGEPSAAAFRGVDGGFGGALTVSSCTMIGTVETRQMTLGENSIFLGTVTADRRQTGCVRFSFVPPASRVPRRFRCQPAILPAGATPHEIKCITARVRPRFTSLRYGDPGYCQLDWRGPEEIRRGAEDGSEMGVFQYLRQPQREDNLRRRLDEYLRLSLEAGIFYVT